MNFINNITGDIIVYNILVFGTQFLKYVKYFMYLGNYECIFYINLKN